MAYSFRSSALFGISIRTGLKIVLIVIAGAVALACGAGWYAVRNPDRLIVRVSTYLQKDTGLPVRIQHIGVRLFPTLTMRIYGLKIGNPRPFPSGNFLSVERIDATIEILPLLHGQMTIGSLLLYKPTFDFMSDPDGLWNFQNPSGAQKKGPAFSISLIPSLRIEKGVLRGLNLVDPTDKPGPVVLDIENFSAQIGRASYKTSEHDHRSTTLEGNLSADSARFGSIHTTYLKSQLRVTSRQLVFSNFEAQNYHGNARGNFLLNFGSKTTTFKTELTVKAIDVRYLLAEFQKGTPAMTGKLQATLSLHGGIAHTSRPLADIQGDAQVIIENGELPELDQKPSMIAMERFRPQGTRPLPASAFSIFTADMELRNNHIYSKRIEVKFYGTNVVGRGDMSLLDSTLGYQGVAYVLNKQSFVTTIFARLFKEAHEEDGRLTFPLRLAGTLSKPTLSIVK